MHFVIYSILELVNFLLGGTFRNSLKLADPLISFITLFLFKEFLVKNKRVYIKPILSDSGKYLLFAKILSMNE